jgi:hypothetical protein
VATEAKPFASLSSGLLARKGAARPAMRPQGFGQGAPGLEDLGWNDMGFEPPKPVVAPVRDAEHDAFGEEIADERRVHSTGLTPVQSPVHDQQAELADRLGVDEEEEHDETAEPFEGEPAPMLALAPTVQAAPRRPSKSRALPGSKGKAAFTLRLDPERHLKLRLACAVNGRSAQQLVTDALDRLLVGMPELDAMADKAKRRG